MIDKACNPLEVGTRVTFCRWHTGTVTELHDENPKNQMQGSVVIRADDGSEEIQPAAAVAAGDFPAPDNVTMPVADESSAGIIREASEKIVELTAALEAANAKIAELSAAPAAEKKSEAESGPVAESAG